MALTLGSLAGSVRPHSAELKLAESFRSWGSFRFQELPNQSADEQSVNLILQPPPPTSTLTPQNPRGKRNPPDTYLTSHFLVFWGQSQHLAHPEKHSHLPKTTCSQLEQLVFCLSCLIVLHSNKSTSSGTSRWTLESHCAVTFMFAGGRGGLPPHIRTSLSREMQENEWDDGKSVRSRSRKDCDWPTVA